MQYPENRLVVGGIDISEAFGLVLLDGYTLTPPSPKTYVVDIPGRSGKLDLTETLLGDTAYDNRSHTFPFAVVDPESVESIKTKVSNFLHGRSFDYQMTMDPDYTYHGRFTIDSYGHTKYSNGTVVDFSIKVDAVPFKMAPNKIYKIDGIGGVVVYFNSGRKRVRPVIQSDGFVKVIFNGTETILGKGTWTINDMYFKEGPNKVYINTYDIKNLLWGDLKTNGITWADFGKKPLFEWYKSKGDGTYVMDTWGSLANVTWESLATKTWADLSYEVSDTSGIKGVYIEYEWGDL